MLVLYHGSVSNFNYIDLSKCTNRGDFGSGFYLSVDKYHAISAGKRKLHSGKGIVYLYTYEVLNNNLDTLIFNNTDVNWLRTVLISRYGNGIAKDVIAGATADASTYNILRRLPINSLSSMTNHEIENIISLLNTNKFAQQFCFRTQKSIQYLRLIGKELIKYK